MDVSSDHSIDHINIDKSPRLHARVISEVLAIVGGHRAPVPGAKPTTVSSPTPGGPAAAPSGGDTAKPEAAPAVPAAPAKSGNGAMNSDMPKHAMMDGGTPVIALPERGAGHPGPDTAAAAPRKPAVAPQPVNSAQVAN